MDKQILYNIEQRELFLYGEAEEIECFLEKYARCLKIKKIITDYKDEVKMQSCLKYGLQTIMFEEAIFDDNSLVVICTRKRFMILSKRLMYAGKKEYQNYISSQLVGCLLEKKKLMVCMGTSFVGQIYYLLNQCKAVRNKYSIVYYPEDELMEIYCNRLQEYIHISRVCDVSISSDCEKKKYPLKKLPAGILPSGSIKITVADFGFWGFYPQIVHDRDVFNDYFLREYQRRELKHETLACARADKEIQLMCENSKCKDTLTINDILEKILDERYFKESEVLAFYDEEVAHWRVMEEKSNIRLSDFLLRNRSNACLCRNLNEWQEPVVSYAANEVLHILNMQPLSLEIEERKKILEENSGSELPIYPSVQKALGLQTMLQDKLYRVVTYESIKYMNLKDYFRYIIEYTMRGIDLLEFTGMNREIKGDI